MSEICVTQLNVYPVKSMQGISVLEANIAETGLAHMGIRDREFMVVGADEDHTFVTQRTEPRLATIKPIVRDHYLRLDVHGYGMAEVDTEYNDKLSRVQTDVHGNSCVGLDMGINAAGFLSDYLGRGVRLVREVRDEPRYVKHFISRKLASNRVAFGDGSPMLLTSEKSLAKQHEDVGLEQGTVPMDRFRPNIVIGGLELNPYEEDTWDMILIGKLAAYVVRACDRCAIPSIVQTGDKSGEQGLVKVKADFLKNRSGIDLVAPASPKGRFFGQNVNHIWKTSIDQSLCVGDKIDVLLKKDPNIQLNQ